MSAPVDVLAVMDPERELGVRQSAKNANAGFVDWRDWCAYLGRSAEARAAVAELIEAVEAAGRSERFDGDAESWVEYSLKFRASRDRLSAALARVKGGAA